MVVRPQAASERIRALRQASRCSMIVMRCSSTTGADRGARRRTLSRRATRRASALGRGGGLRALGRGGLGGDYRRGRRRRSRGGGRCGRHLVGELGSRLAELAHRLADGATQLGKPAWAEDDEHDHEDDHEPDGMEWHLIRLYAPEPPQPPRSGHPTWMLIEVIRSAGEVSSSTLSIPLITVPNRL